MAGKKKSAVTLFMVNEGIDTGKILAQEEFSLEGSLSQIFQRITVIGRKLLKDVLTQYPDFKLYPQKGRATYCKRKTPEESRLTTYDFSVKTAEELYNFIRALADPYPNAFIDCADGKRLYFKEVSLGT
jgi:methionyl-tRNA formyltransferase